MNILHVLGIMSMEMMGWEHGGGRALGYGSMGA